MKTQTRMTQVILNKILKDLEGKGLVKTVKTEQNRLGRMYILAELTPAENLTGNTWCAFMNI